MTTARRAVPLASVLALAGLLAGCGGADPQAAEEAAASTGTIGVTVYGDALAAGWSDWSWASRNLANAAPVWDGSRSIAVTYGPWQGLYFHSAGTSTAGLAALELSVDGGSTSGPALAACVTVAGAQRTKVALAPFCAGGTIPANAWTRCRIPLTALGASGATIDGVVVQESAGRSLPVLYVDAVALTPPVAVAVSPASAALTTGGTQQLTATVTGTATTGVAWTVQEGTAGGSVTSAGLYTAPAAAGTYHVVATSVADRTKSATATVSVAAPPPPPAPPPTSSSSITVYGDALAPGWSDWSWATRNLANPAPVADGSASIAATFGAWQGLYFHASPGVSTANLSALELSIDGGATANPALAVCVTVAGAQQTKVALAPYCAGGIPAGAWTRCHVPLSALAAAGATIDGVVIQENAGSSLPVLYVDAVALTSDAAAPPPPPPPATTPLLPASRTTTWAPGIPGGVPTRTTVCATIDAATYGNGSTDATAAIQSAVDACPADQVVYLPAGTYKLSNAIFLHKRVVLRGAGANSTTLSESPSGVAVMIGSWTSFGTPLSLTADAAKGSTALAVSDASGIAVGDILHLDQLDDPAVVQGQECPYLKRGSAGAWRSIGQMVEVTAKAGNTLTLASPLHWTFTTALQAQLVPLSPQPTRYAGLEDLHIVGGGTVAVNMQYAAYSWVKGVETDHVDGVHVSMAGTYRCVLRDSYAHHSVTYSYGGGSYGYSLEWQASDNLVENNIVTYMNKPIQFRASGGGNVVAYNYVDDSWSQPDSGGNFWFQELSIDVHCAFPFMNLVEGNYAPHLGGASTWGNAGYLTFFRNQATSVNRTIALTGPNAPANQAAVELDARMIGMNVVGNVLGSPGLAGARYETAGPSDCRTFVPFVYRFNYDGATGYCSFPTPVDTQASDTALLHGNYDYVTRSVQWSPTLSSQTLPASLYLTSKPAFFGSYPWPWVDPSGPTIGTLPAKARFDAGTPNG